MKKALNSSFVQLTQNELKNLTSEVKETIAVGFFRKPENKIFTAANLWNIQRQTKTRMQRRFI